MKVVSTPALALLGMTSVVNGLVARSAGTANDIVKVVLGLQPVEKLTDAQKAIFPNPNYLDNGLYVTAAVVNTNGQFSGGYLSTTTDKGQALIFTKNNTKLSTHFNDKTQYLNLDFDSAGGAVQLNATTSTDLNPNYSTVQPASTYGFEGFYACFGMRLTTFWGVLYSGPFPKGGEDQCIKFEVQEQQDIPQATTDFSKVLAQIYPPGLNGKTS